MEPIGFSEFLLLFAMVAHLFLAPGTKVEESFNMQATHDMTYHIFNISKYDHHSFPGVVPRTFAGPGFLSIFGLSARFIAFLFNYTIPKYVMQVIVRGTLGLTTLYSFCTFCRSVGRVFGQETTMFLKLITASQFHFLFYSSRTLPNTFALFFVLFTYSRLLDGRYLSAVRWATTAAVLFRVELVILFGPMFLIPIVMGQLKLQGENGAIITGCRAAFSAIFATVPLDSLLWNRFLWPELQVAFFNIVENRSHEYGVLPFLWYFYSAIPRALLLTVVFIPLGLLLDKRLYPVVIPALIFVFLYSFLPHKELRFIIYAFPLLNLAAAVFCARMYNNRNKSWKRELIFLICAGHLVANFGGTAFLSFAASRNYPGFKSALNLQIMKRFESEKPNSVYVDNSIAQTGFTRFLELYDKWEYNKTESLKPKDLERFKFLLVGTYGDDLRDIVDNYSSSHRVLFITHGFHRISYKLSHHRGYERVAFFTLVHTYDYYWSQISKQFPFIEISVAVKEKAAALVHKEA